jgi:tRNA nucleotidyltransferase (CCA-adding enzyme)
VSHDRFGTVQLRAGALAVDLATARAERYEAPGALPTVEAGTLEQDLERRDFSVNALAIPLTRVARRGRAAVIDVGRGVADLREGVLRVFHGRSFHDDPTRAFRASRLAPRLGFTLSRTSRSALRSALRDGAFGAVSGERFHAELAKLFADSSFGLDPSRALRLLSDWHVLAAVEPGLSQPREVTAPLRRLGRSLAEPPWSDPPERPWVAGLMVWLAPLEAPLRRRALRRLAVSGEAARRISGFARSRDAWLRTLERARGRGGIDAALQTADDDELLALLAWAPPTARRRIIRYARDDRPMRLPVNGDDLVAIGLSGPAVGRALARIRIAVLDRAVETREEALALAQELARRRGGRARPAARS